MPSKARQALEPTAQPSGLQGARLRSGVSAADPQVAGQRMPLSHTGRLAAMAAAANGSPRVQAQLGLADEAAKSAPVQRLKNLATAAQGSQSAPVQLYRPLARDQYEVLRQDEGPERDESALFTIQSKKPALMEDEETGYAIRHKIAESDYRQDLNIAEDGSIAINNTKFDAKEFYAADAVFQDSKEKLGGANSAVRLVKSGGLSIDAGSAPLYKITPESALDEAQAEAAQFTSLASDICIELASSIMAKGISAENHQVVLQGTDSEEQRRFNIASGEDQADPKISRLGAFVGQSEKAKHKGKGAEIRGSALEQVHAEDEATEEGVKGYGKRSGRGELASREKQLGVNRYARPEIGEAYAAFSLPADAGKQIDYSAGHQAVDRMGQAWGYHFAAVVAKSLDGQDTITLENYNRKDQLNDRFKDLLHRLVAENMQALGQKLQGLAPLPKDSRTDVYNKFVQAIALIKGFDKVDSNKAFEKVRDTYVGKQAWFFKMQGSRKKQSFHEQEAASGEFFNPLTLRVAPRNPKTEAFRVQAVQALTYPALPSLLQPEPEFKDFGKLTDAAVRAVKDALTEKLVRNARDQGLAGLAKYLLESMASAVVRMTRQHGLEVPDKLAASVASAKNVANKSKNVVSLATHCHDVIERGIQALWLTETEKKLAMTKDEFAVLEAWKHAPLVASHFAGKHGK